MPLSQVRAYFEGMNLFEQGLHNFSHLKYFIEAIKPIYDINESAYITIHFYKCFFKTPPLINHQAI